MGVFKLSRKIRGAPRLRVQEDEHYNQIRFTTRARKQIVGARIFDISETGISFISNKRFAPQIGDTIMMEFIPINSIQIACMGRVIRIETSGKSKNQFADYVKVGVAYHHLPVEYKKIISDSLKRAFSLYKGSVKQVYHTSRSSEAFAWFTENWQSIIATTALLIGTYAGAKMIWESTRDIKPESPEWSRGVFEKVLKK